MFAATLLEHYNENCVSYDKSLLTQGESTGVLVFGWRSRRSLQFLSTILEQGEKYPILMSSSDLLNERRYKTPQTSMIYEQPELKWGFVNARSRCQVSVLRELVQQYKVDTVHVSYDEFDFLPVQNSSDAGAIMRCFIILMQSLSKQPQIEVYLHLKQQRRAHYFSPYSDEVGSMRYSKVHDEEGGTSKQTDLLSKPWRVLSNKCDPLYDYQRLFDVFQKSVDIYASTFKNIYSMTIHTVVEAIT